jgi:hypothetical protein
MEDKFCLGWSRIRKQCEHPCILLVPLPVSRSRGSNCFRDLPVPSALCSWTHAQRKTDWFMLSKDAEILRWYEREPLGLEKSIRPHSQRSSLHNFYLFSVGKSHSIVDVLLYNISWAWNYANMHEVISHQRNANDILSECTTYCILLRMA